MVRDVAFGQYFPAKSLIHKLDPRAKIIMLIAFLVLVFCTFNYAALAVVAVCTAAIVLMSGVPVKFYFKSLKIIIFIVIVTSILNLFYGTGDPIWQWGIIKITVNGINRSVFVTVRIICLILASSALTFTTSPTELTDAIERLMKPLNKVHFPVHEIAMMMSIALRFIPILTEELDKIMKAQMSRGVDFESGNILERGKKLIPVLVPLFIAAIRRASDLAMAMDARCYNGGEGKTRLHPLVYKKQDYAAYGIMLLYVAIMIFCSFILI